MRDKLARKCIDSHFEFLRGWSFDHEHDIRGAKVILRNDSDNVYLNSANRFNASAKCAGRMIEEVCEFMEQEGKQPSFYVTCLSRPEGLDQTLTSLGFIQDYSDACKLGSCENLEEFCHKLQLRCEAGECLSFETAVKIGLCLEN